MWKCKWYAILLPWLFLLLVFLSVACSQPPATTEKSPQEVQPASQKPAEFEVGPITFAPPVVMVGDSLTITATVKNTGDVAGTYTAALSVDGQEVDSKAIPVDPESSKEASFQLSKTTAGSYKLAIGNSNTTLTVSNWSPYTIQYDESDGSVMGIYVSGENGHVVHFTPPAKPFKIQKIRVFGTARIKYTSEFDKNHVTVRIWDKEGNNQLWSQDFPWRLFFGSGNLREIKVPDVRVDDDFHVELVTHSDPRGGDPINLDDIIRIIQTLPTFESEELWDPPRVVLIGFDYPQSSTNSPSNRPETRSGYSYMGKLIDPGQGRLKGIRWLIRVEGEGAAGN